MQRSPDLPQPERRDLCDVFVKIGGSILDHDASTAALVPNLIEPGRRHRILILTGGGQSAKRIKANQTRNGGDFYRFWRATGLCPEVNAYVLASYSNSFSIVSCAAEISACFAAGNIAVFAPTGAILNSLYFFPNWLVTTDSMGLHFANQSGARRYVIVSDVDGIYHHKPENGACMAPIARLSIAELGRLSSSKLDPGFAGYFRCFPLSTFIVNGNHPDRVGAAICGLPTVGTEIVVPERESAGAPARESDHLE
jgi:5-(aminomethyl)-3-furanmethanol phosphate kinase